MCMIVCQACNKPIADDENAYQVRQGFVEKGDFTPEQEVAFFHLACYPITDNQLTE